MHDPESARPEFPMNQQFEPPTDLGALFQTLAERAWIIILCIALALLAAGYYVKRAPRIYEATATVQVEQEQQRPVKTEQRNTPRKAVLRCVQLLNKAGAKVEGVVLNLLPPRRSRGPATTVSDKQSRILSTSRSVPWDAMSNSSAKPVMLFLAPIHRTQRLLAIPECFRRDGSEMVRSSLAMPSMMRRVQFRDSFPLWTRLMPLG